MKFSAKLRQRSLRSSALKEVSKFLPVLCFVVACAEYRKVLMNKQKMTEKKSENEMVMSEFKMLGEDAVIYKMVGPVLAK